MRSVPLVLMLVCLLLVSSCAKVDAAPTIPAPLVDERGGPATDRFAVFAGGCFWGIEAVFEHIKGVKSATSGYAGGTAATAHYQIVSGGKTGHAEAVQVVYDPTKTTYGQLLQVFFSVAHDPTLLDHQGPDYGPQYRSALFFASEDQERIAKAYIDQLNKAKVFKKPIVTKVTPLDAFYPAEPNHQDFMAHHPNDLYIMMNDAPKVVHLQEQFPQIYEAK